MPRFPFRLATLALLIVIIGLATALFVQQRRYTAVVKAQKADAARDERILDRYTVELATQRKLNELQAKGALPSLATSSLQSSGNDAKLAINVDDIGTKVTLVGRLGQPLGKMMKLRGSWKYPDGLAKDYSLRFTVTEVNDHKLATPVEFNIAQIKARTEDDKDAIPEYKREKDLDGVAWTLNAYETGRFSVVPQRGFSVALPYWQRAFTSEVVGTVAP